MSNSSEKKSMFDAVIEQIRKMDLFELREVQRKTCGEIRKRHDEYRGRMQVINKSK